MIQRIKKQILEFSETGIRRSGVIIYSLLFIFHFFLRVVNNIYDAFLDIKDIRRNLKKAAKNNYKLGKIMLSDNKINDAHIRFWFANLFYKDSYLVLFQLSYVNFLKEDFKTSLKYIERVLILKSNFKQAIHLLDRIELEINKTLNF